MLEPAGADRGDLRGVRHLLLVFQRGRVHAARPHLDRGFDDLRDRRGDRRRLLPSTSARVDDENRRSSTKAGSICRFEEPVPRDRDGCLHPPLAIGAGPSTRAARSPLKTRSPPSCCTPAADEKKRFKSVHLATAHDAAFTAENGGTLSAPRPRRARTSFTYMPLTEWRGEEPGVRRRRIKRSHVQSRTTCIRSAGSNTQAIFGFEARKLLQARIGFAGERTVPGDRDRRCPSSTAASSSPRLPRVALSRIAESGARTAVKTRRCSSDTGGGSDEPFCELVGSVCMQQFQQERRIHSIPTGLARAIEEGQKRRDSIKLPFPFR